MRFGILGPLEVRSAAGDPLDAGGPRPRALLTLLLLGAGGTVAVEHLVDGLYGDRPPKGAVNALQAQVSRLRGRLRLAINAVPGGYRLAVDPRAVDTHRFEHLAGGGHEALTLGDPARAAALLGEALGLWRGPALADLPAGHARAARYEELRLTAVEDRMEARLALGIGPGPIAELRELITAHPLREALYGQLMRALHLAGRTAEALAVYEQARRTLADELGADPSARLATLHLDLLQGGGQHAVHHTSTLPTRGASRPDLDTPRTAMRATQPGTGTPDPCTGTLDPCTEPPPPGAGTHHTDGRAPQGGTEAPVPAGTGHPDEAPAASPGPAIRPPQGLPAQLTRLVGREDELARVDALLTGSRLVTLTGPGGAGKTRLAIEAARAYRASALDQGAEPPRREPPAHEPVCYVELAPLADGARISYAVLGALGVREGTRAHGAETTERLLRALEGRRLLLVLDNCEHLIDDAARITVLLLSACPGVRVLATSREALSITGEALCQVPPLATPFAVRLFLDRATAVRPGHQLDGAHARVARIC